MNKRSLIFVLGLTIALFLVQQWYNSKDQTRQAERTSQKPVEQKTAAPLPATPSPSAPLPAELSDAALKSEQFYVIENDYQQLVISSLGGALSEINLPYKTKQNPLSAVREIDFDREIKRTHPRNTTFPLFPYFKAGEKGEVKKVEQGSTGGYYPLLRRQILGPLEEAAKARTSRYYAFNVLTGENEPDRTSYKVKRLEKDLIELESVGQNRRIVKTYSFPKEPARHPYCFEFSIKVEGDMNGLRLTSGVPEVELVSGSFSPVLKYRLTRNQKSVVEQIDLPKTVSTFTSVSPQWVSNSNGFLGLIIDPRDEMGSGFSAINVPGAVDPTRLTLIDPAYNLYPAKDYPGYEIQLPLRASSQAFHFHVFAGPFQGSILKIVDAGYADPQTGAGPDYAGALSFQGWFTFISEPFAQFLFILMKFFYQITSSWGISIILLTIALRIMLYPLNNWSIKSTTKMQMVAPQVAAIQEKFKKEPKRAQLEVMNLYREKGVNPMTGCFPILIQIPFLIGMFDLLKSTFELRGAVFIPGWINNLSSPDVVFSWNYPLIFFGTEFHLLPVILGAAMYFQQKMSSSLPKNGQSLTDQQKQQKMMGNIMTIVFTVMFYHFPSGLNLYWLSSMLLGILQQWYTAKKMAPLKK